MNVRLKNVGDGNLRLARHIDINLYVRPRIKHGGYSLVVVSQKIGEFRDAFGLDGFKNKRHDRTLRQSDGQVQQDQQLSPGERTRLNIHRTSTSIGRRWLIIYVPRS